MPATIPLNGTSCGTTESSCAAPFDDAGGETTAMFWDQAHTWRMAAQKNAAPRRRSVGLKLYVHKTG
ncbi:MAG: hypothetical protein WBE36_04725, partial [Terracidiphilus sp.]